MEFIEFCCGLGGLGGFYYVLFVFLPLLLLLLLFLFFLLRFFLTIYVTLLHMPSARVSL
jgi:hypothetical protein